MINRGIKDPSVTLESSRERSGIIIPVKIDPERLRASILQLGRESPSPGQPAAFSGPSEQSQLDREGKGGGFSQQSPKTGEEPRGKRCRAGKTPREGANPELATGPGFPNGKQPLDSGTRPIKYQRGLE